MRVPWRKPDERDGWIDRLELRSLRADIRRAWEIGVKVRRGGMSHLIVTLHVRPGMSAVFGLSAVERSRLAELLLEAHGAADEVSFHEPLPLERAP